MTRIATVVQHHPSRADLLPRLLPHLDDPLVVADPGGDVSSPWRSQRLCLRAGGEATHVLIIQDDAIVAEGFSDAVEAAIAARPEACIAFFVSAAARSTAWAMTDALKKRQPFAHWCVREHWPVVCSSYPVAIAERIADLVDARAKEPRGDDGPIGDAMRIIRPQALVSVPSLAQHPDDTPSLIGRQHLNGLNPGRRAKYFCEGDARKIRWGTSPR